MSRPDPWRISHQTVAEATDSKSIFAQRQGFADSPVTETTWQRAAVRAPLRQPDQVREIGPIRCGKCSTANSQLTATTRYGEVVFPSVAGAESPPLPESPASGPLQPKRGRIQAAEMMAMKKDWRIVESSLTVNASSAAWAQQTKPNFSGHVVRRQEPNGVVRGGQVPGASPTPRRVRLRNASGCPH